MASRILSSAICTNTRRSSVFQTMRASIYSLSKIGKREVVGFGKNGSYSYQDRLIFAMPAIRFKEPTVEYECLNAKQQLPWNKLSIPEKKALYRYSFCQTFAEQKAGSGEWKMHIGISLVLVAIGIWISLWQYAYMYDEFPDTFTEERRKAQLERILALEVNPINGIASQWDYENKKWK